MKNVIKRGTSLLLVLAMLLSFAAVVGAEEPATPEKILTLTVENAVLHAGETKCLPVYETVKEGHSVDMVTLSAISDNKNVVVKGVYAGIPAEWTGKKWIYKEGENTVLTNPRLEGISSAAAPEDIPLLTWLGYDDSFTTSDLPLCYVQVTATADAAPGAYQINMTKDPNVQEKTLFSIVNPEGGPSITKTADDAILNPGTAVVIPATASLPTVILTKTAFEAPTQAGLSGADEVRGDYALTKYVKLVTEEGLVDVTSLSVTVNGDKSVSLKQGNVLSLATTAEKDKGYKLTVTAANGEQLAAAVELPFTVSKQDSAFTMAGFTKNGGYSMDFAGPYEAPAYSGTTANKFVPLDPKAYDQYGMPMGQATTELKLYSDAACTKEITSGNAFESVTVAAETGSVQISKNLRADVWCKVRASATIDGVTKTSEWITFQIKSNYPQAASATVVLGDMNGNEFPSGPVTTIDIPYGTTENKTFSIIVKDFRQANGETMPEGTAPSATDVAIALDGTHPGVSISNGNKLVIDKTAQAGTVTVKATLNGKELGTLTLTLQRAASKATDAGVYDRENKTANTNSKVLPTLSGVESGKATLPGIREGDKLVLTFGPGCVVDQYGEIYQVEGKDFLRPSQYALYKQSSTNPETYELCAEAERSVNAEGVVTATIKNSLDSDGNLRVQPGTYKFGTYNDNFFNGTTRFDLNQLLMSEPFELVEGEAELSGTPIYYGVEAGNEPTLYVPYKYGTLDSEKTNTMNVGAAIKTQYGRPYGSSETPAYALNNVKLNEETIENKAITWTAEADGTGVTFTVDKSAAQLFGTSNTATLTAEMTVTVGEKSTQSIPISITIKKEASVLSAVKVEMAEDTAFTTGLRTWSANRTSESKKGEVTLLSPNAKKTWYIRRTAEDQYGVEMDIQSLVTATGCSWSYDTDKATGKILYFKLGVPAGYEDSFILKLPNKKPEYKFTAKFVPMQFVKSETGKNDTFQLSDYLNRTANEDGTFSAEYNGQPWSTILAKNPNAKVYIKTAEGENNTEIPSDKLTLEVTKDGAPVGMDAKANAGSYQVKLVYTDAEGQKYTVDEKTFTITPKTVKITVTGGTIRKEYDGTANLPDVTLAVTAYETLNVDKSVLKFAQENVGTDINVELTSAGTNCLKTASGEPATNYTADLSELKGTIAPRKLIVTPKAKTFEYGENDKITNALTTEFDYADKNGDLPSGLTPTITGSMKLTTTSGADVTVYNAGTYHVVNNNLSAGTNYEIEFPATSVQWTINRKLLTKVKNSGLPQSMFGTNTDKGCISRVLESLVIGEDVAWKVSDFVDASALSFPSNTVYVTGQNGTQYPAPGPYMLNVTKPKKDIGKNYRVDETTVYEFDYTVNKLDASLLTVTLTEDTYTYNGMEQGPTVSVTYTNRANDTLDLTSSCTIGGTTKATDAGTYTITVTSDLVSGSKTATWKINPKTITKDMFSQKEPHPVYDGTEQTLTGSVLDGKDSEIKVNGENKVLQLGTDFTAGEVKETNAGEYTMTVTGQGNYTGTANVKVKIDKFVATGENLLLSMSISSNQVTRGKTTTLYIDTAVLLKSDEVEQFNGRKEGKVTWLVGNNTPNATINVEALENQKKLKVTVTVPNDATPDKEHAQIAITLQTAFNVDGGTHQNIESGQVRTYQLYVTDKEQQENFKIDQGESGTYSYSQGSLQLTASGSATGSTVTWSSSDTSVATVDNGKVTFVKPGDATITATASETDDYAAAADTYTLTITKGQVTITASSATMTANEALPGFSATASGLNPKDSVSDVFQTLTATVSTDGKTAGTYPVTPNAVLKAGWDAYYDLYFVPGTLTVNPAQTAIDVVLPIIIGGNTCANGYANCACESFYDLDASRWYHEAIDWAYSLGLMNGTTKSTFGPNAAATRAQTWTMLARIAGQDTRRSSTWYEVGQKWAMNLGITDGMNPMGSLTREQLAAMLYRYVGSPAVNGTLTFTDSANVSAWARNAMIWAVQNGILDGVGGNRLNPKGTTTRAQAAAIFMRFSKLINK